MPSNHLESFSGINTPIDLRGMKPLETDSLFPLLKLDVTKAKTQIRTLIQPDYSHIIFFPHSNTEDNRDNLFSGSRETPLTTKGHQEAQIYADVLSVVPIHHIYHSTLERSQHTAQPIIDNNPLAIVYEEKALNERSYGQLEGQKKTGDLRDIHHACKQFDVTPPGGESLHMVQQRIMTPLANILQRASQAINNLAVVTHANTTRVLVKVMTNLHRQHTSAIGAVRHTFFIFRISPPDIILLPAIKLLPPNNQKSTT